jgi:NADH dehydrogenase
MAASGDQRPHRVVVVGGGFGGLRAVRALRRAPVEVTLVDRRNFHTFQPLLYQVGTGALSPGEIASPLRGIFKRQRNVTVLLAEVAGFDLERRRVILGRQANGDAGEELEYDSLIVGGGSSHAYFGHDEWEAVAPGLKSIEDALRIRHKILAAFEAAELEADPERRREWLTFAVVGAGPTGVELAGQIGEIARDALKHDFRRMNPRDALVLLIEAADRVLTTYTPKLSAKAARALERRGVTPLTGKLVVGLDRDSVTVTPSGGGEPERIGAKTVLWAAGVAASPLARKLADAAGAEVDRSGHITVRPDLTVPGHPEVIAIGDMVRVEDPEGDGVQPLPGVAPAAMQEGTYAGRSIRARLAEREPKPFRYTDKGSLATIGRMAAVADIKGIRFAGLFAWLTWLFVHLMYLNGLQNRLIVFLRWVLSFVTRGRAQRLITGDVGGDPWEPPLPPPERRAGEREPAGAPRR